MVLQQQSLLVAANTKDDGQASFDGSFHSSTTEVVVPEKYNTERGIRVRPFTYKNHCFPSFIHIQMRDVTITTSSQ